VSLPYVVVDLVYDISVLHTSTYTDDHICRHCVQIQRKLCSVCRIQWHNSSPNSKAEQQTSLNILWRLISIGISESQDKSVLLWLQPFKLPPFHVPLWKVLLNQYNDQKLPAKDLARLQYIESYQKWKNIIQMWEVAQVVSCKINNSGFFLLISTWKIIKTYLAEVTEMTIGRHIFVWLKDWCIDLSKNNLF
jgi:hypothetical protein